MRQQFAVVLAACVSVLTTGAAVPAEPVPKTGVHSDADRRIQIRRLSHEGVLGAYDKSDVLAKDAGEPRFQILRGLLAKLKTAKSVETSFGKIDYSDKSLALSPEEEKRFSLNSHRLFTDVQRIRGGRVFHPQAITDPDDYLDTVLLTGNNSLCSGILITPVHVITAAHCYCAGAFDVTIGRSLFPYVARADTDVVKSKTHIACDKLIPESNFWANAWQGDIALYTLVRPVEGVPIRKIASEATLRNAHSFVAVGFGRTSLRDDTPGIKYLSPPIVISSPDCVEPQVGEFCRPIFELKAGSSVADTCEGDSGGPAIVTAADGVRYVAAVTSRPVIKDTCGRGGIYVKLNSEEIHSWLVNNGVPQEAFQAN